MGNASSSVVRPSSAKMMDSDKVENLSFLEEGSFAKVYKGVTADSRGNKVRVAIKVPKVPESIRKEKSKGNQK